MKRVAFALVVACSHPKPEPTAAVKQTIDSAEDAERHRQHDLARARYEDAIRAATDPTSEAFARHEYAGTLSSWGEFAEAKAQLDKAIAAKPDHAPSWHDLGYLRNHDGDFAGAREAFERSKALAPDDLRPRKSLAVFLLSRGDLDGAEREYREMLTFDLPDNVREKVQQVLRDIATKRARHVD